MERIQIKYFTDKIDRLTYIGGVSDWIDLRCAENVELSAGEFRLIPLGVAMKLPKGYEAHIVPRSSTFKNFGIIQTNHMGIIDESYCGGNDQWYFPAYALRDTKIRVNDRICQFRIMEHQPQVVFDEVDELEGQDRGGLGSTGIGAVLGKVRCLLAAVCVVSVLGTAGCGGSQKEREEIRLLGIEQLDGGNYEEAIQSFEQALALSSKVVGEFELDILKYRAEAEYRAGDYQAAAYTYQVLMQVDEEREEYRTRVCRLYIAAGQLDEAVEEYKKLYEAGSEETARILLALGQALTEAGRFDEAMGLYEQAVDGGVASGELYNRMAVCELEAGETDLALQYLEQGVKTGDQSVMGSLYLNQAAAYEKKLDFARALTILEQYTAAYGADPEIQKEMDFLKTR